MNRINRMLRSAWQYWDNFFFGPIDLYNVGLFRMIFGFSILLLYLLRMKGFDVFFLDNGLVPYEWAQKLLPEQHRTILPFFIADDFWMKIHGYLHIFMIALLTVGLIGRESTWFLFILQLGLLQRNITVAYGADLFALFWLMYLSIIDHNRYFSLWNLAWLKRWKLFGKSNSKSLINDSLSGPVSTLGIRLLQIQLCFGYAYTGFEKLKGVQWWEGTAVWYVIGMEELILPDFTFLRNFPIAIGALTQLTIIFEVYFIFAVWTRMRNFWLFVGTLFHLATALGMGLYFFCLVMISPYVLFLEANHLRQWIKRIGLENA